jgi:hypothetical protein
MSGLQLVAPYRQLCSISRTTVRGGWQYLKMLRRCASTKNPPPLFVFYTELSCIVGPHSWRTVVPRMLTRMYDLFLQRKLSKPSLADCRRFRPRCTRNCRLRYAITVCESPSFRPRCLRVDAAIRDSKLCARYSAVSGSPSFRSSCALANPPFAIRLLWIDIVGVF